jgi:hypothetical protein
MKLPTAICLVTLLAMPVLAAAGEMKMEMGGTPADQAFAYVDANYDEKHES